MYRRSLEAQCPDVRVPFAARDTSSHHIMPIVLPHDADRNSVITRLRDDEIQTTIHYPPAHRLSFYRSPFPSVQLEKTEEFARRELTLPLHPRMEGWQAEAVCCALAKSLTYRELKRGLEMSPVEDREARDQKADATTSSQRQMDLAIAIIALAVSSPVMVLVALAICIETGRPIFYSQTRIGRGGRRFRIHKFRKFHKDARAGCPLTVEHDPRMTRIGRFPRADQARRATAALERGRGRDVDRRTEA